MRFRSAHISGVVLVAVAAVGVSGGSAMAAGPCAVPTGSHPTIQSAVLDPTCNPINVAEGRYEEQVKIMRTVTLNGAQAGVDARTRSGEHESVITDKCGPVQIEADNVKIDGFTIEGSELPDPCFLSGIWTNPGGTGTHGGHTIVNDIVQNNISGIELDSDGTFPTLVQHNLILNNNKPGPGSGNGIQTNFELRKAKVEENKFSGDTSSSFLVVTASSNINVTGNELVGGNPEGFAFASVSNTAISANTSIGSTSTGTVDLFGGDSGITITANVLANGVRGIQVENPFAVGANSAISAHENCISGNSIAGLEEDLGGYSPVSAGSLNAKENWWGSPSGPTIASNPGGNGDRIVDTDGVVDYKPWTTTQPAAPCPVAFEKLASGSFVIGDKNAAMGSSVTFWGAKWAKLNTLSGGPAPASFKGFADETTANPPTCGQHWGSDPGASSNPPASVPQVMPVIVSSSIGKSKSDISGDTVHVVLVKTNPGYAPSPGHAGTGTVVGTLC
jgi:hypothetical protein